MYSRPEYVDVVGVEKISTVSLDRFIREQQLTNVAYAKIDVEGFELEVLSSAKKLLSTSLAFVRTEAAFLCTRRDQPTYGQVEEFFRDHGFIPLDFPEMHSWRLATKRRYPIICPNEQIPFSKGQLAHCDVFFLRDPLSFKGREAAQIIAAVFLLISHNFIDLALHLLTITEFSKELDSKYEMETSTELRKISLTLAALHSQKRRARFLRGIRSRIQRLL